MKLQIDVVCVLKKHITSTTDYWRKIIRLKHPAMRGKEVQVAETLVDADEVRQSISDPQVKLYYRKYSDRHLCVVAKHTNGEGFIITAYFTDRIKEGHSLWTKS